MKLLSTVALTGRGGGRAAGVGGRAVWRWRLLRWCLRLLAIAGGGPVATGRLVRVLAPVAAVGRP